MLMPFYPTMTGHCGRQKLQPAEQFFCRLTARHDGIPFYATDWRTVTFPLVIPVAGRKHTLQPLSVVTASLLLLLNSLPG